MLRLSLVALLLAAPLAFGAVEPWAWGGMVIMISFIAVVWAVACIREGAIRLLGSTLYIPVLILLIVGALQLSIGTSLNPWGTREALIKITVFILVFFLAQHLYASASSKEWNTTTTIIAIYVFLMALFSIMQFFIAPGLMYGVIEPRQGGNPFGTYVNRNHYSGLMELLIPLAAVPAISRPGKYAARPFLLFVVVLSLVSVVLSGSRGGLAAVIGECIVLDILILIAKPLERRSWKFITTVSICCMLIVVGLIMLWLDPGIVWSRWEEMAKAPQFVVADRITWITDSYRMARSHLVYGVGLGAFEVAFPAYQKFSTDYVVDYAHNDYVQLFAESGILGLIVLLAFVCSFFRLSLRQLRHRGQRCDVAHLTRLAASTSICGILIHSFCDFNFHIPANALIAAFALAISTLPSQATTAYQGAVYSFS